ncbi:phage tail tube protein [uncultured Tateyamaria sp.]|uniref:phage tail tube protein n=1 Tax=uncultured Tateyamaria sp. TaxID=455651 RepID=UPI002620CC1F|nr:phage tail tube protein [uncultured Tateyamaria sp.]
MTISSSGAVRGYGSTVKIIVGGDPGVTTDIVGVGDFEFPDQTPGNIDVTHHGSPGDTEEMIRDMKTAATWALNHHYVPGSDMDAALSAVADSGETFILEITAKDAPPVQFTSYLNSYRPTGIAPKGSVMMAVSTFTVMAQVTA